MSSVLILGATSDIGYAIAKRYAAAGYDIQLAGRNLTQLEILRKDLTVRSAVGCSTHSFDVRNMEEHQAFYQSLSEKPDITICVVGFMADNEQVIADPKLLNATMETNYNGPVSILNIVAADYVQRKSGTIIGISSVAGIRGRQSNYIYGSAKSGFTTYLSGLRNSLYHHGVHVLTVVPGFVRTRMTAELNLPGLLTAEPEEVAEAVFRAGKKKTNVLFVKWFWKWIMLIIKLVPEFIFKKKKL